MDTFIERLCQTPAILWNVWDYCIPPITDIVNERRKAATILLYIFGKATHQLDGMWKLGIENYIQSRLSEYFQQLKNNSEWFSYAVNNSEYLSYFTFYTTYVRKFSKKTFQWYQVIDRLPHDWNDTDWISQEDIMINLN